MKKIGKLFLAVFIGFLSSALVVNAASKCDYNEQAELNNAVANIKVSFEEATKSTGKFVEQLDGKLSEITYDYFKISIYNMSEDVYIRITNDYNNEVKTITYANTESGVGVYEWNHLDKVANFKITVYSSDKTGCPNEEYRIITLVTPRYNSYSGSAMCTDNEEFYLCQKYITETEEVDLTTFENKLSSFIKNNENNEIAEEKNEENKNILEKVSNFIKEYKLPIIIISTVIVIGGVVTTVIVIKKRRSRLI